MSVFHPLDFSRRRFGPWPCRARCGANSSAYLSRRDRPLARLRKTEDVLTRLGADVTTQVYPGSGHGVVEDEIKALRTILNQAPT